MSVQDVYEHIVTMRQEYDAKIKELEAKIAQLEKKVDQNRREVITGMMERNAIGGL